MTADTTAMNAPHEIEYTLIFDKASIKGKFGQTPRIIGVGMVIIALIVGAAALTKKRGTSDEA